MNNKVKKERGEMKKIIYGSLPVMVLIFSFVAGIPGNGPVQAQEFSFYDDKGNSESGNLGMDSEGDPSSDESIKDFIGELSEDQKKGLMEELIQDAYQCPVDPTQLDVCEVIKQSTDFYANSVLDAPTRGSIDLGLTDFEEFLAEAQRNCASDSNQVQSEAALVCNSVADLCPQQGNCPEDRPCQYAGYEVSDTSLSLIVIYAEDGTTATSDGDLFEPHARDDMDTFIHECTVEVDCFCSCGGCPQ